MLDPLRKEGDPSFLIKAFNLKPKNARYIPNKPGPDCSSYLTNLEQVLDHQKGAGLCILTAMGGVGKSQLALSYGHTYQEKYDVVWWIDASSKETINMGYKDLLFHMGHSIPSEQTRQKADLYRIRTLLGRSKKYLLIYDNMPDPSLMDILSIQNNGDVVITSREANEWTGMVMKIDVFTEEDALNFVTNSLKQVGKSDQELDDKRDVLIKLVRRVGFHPLALSQAISFLAKRACIDDYEQKLNRNFSDFLSHHSRISPEKESVMATLSIMSSQINSGARRLFNFLSFLENSYIPLEMFMNDLTSEEEIEELESYSMIDICEKRKYISIHSLAQEVNLTLLKKDQLSPLPVIIRFIDLLNIFWSEENSPYGLSLQSLFHDKELFKQKDKILEVNQLSFYAHRSIQALKKKIPVFFREVGQEVYSKISQLEESVQYMMDVTHAALLGSIQLRALSDDRVKYFQHSHFQLLDQHQYEQIGYHSVRQEYGDYAERSRGQSIYSNNSIDIFLLSQSIDSLPPQKTIDLLRLAAPILVEGMTLDDVVNIIRALHHIPNYAVHDMVQLVSKISYFSLPSKQDILSAEKLSQGVFASEMERIICFINSVADLKNLQTFVPILELSNILSQNFLGGSGLPYLDILRSAVSLAEDNPSNVEEFLGNNFADLKRLTHKFQRVELFHSFSKSELSKALYALTNIGDEDFDVFYNKLITLTTGKNYGPFDVIEDVSKINGFTEEVAQLCQHLLKTDLDKWYEKNSMSDLIKFIISTGSQAPQLVKSIEPFQADYGHRELVNFSSAVFMFAPEEQIDAAFQINCIKQIIKNFSSRNALFREIAELLKQYANDQRQATCDFVVSIGPKELCLDSTLEFTKFLLDLPIDMKEDQCFVDMMRYVEKKISNVKEIRLLVKLFMERQGGYRSQEMSDLFVQLISGTYESFDIVSQLNAFDLLLRADKETIEKIIKGEKSDLFLMVEEGLWQEHKQKDSSKLSSHGIQWERVESIITSDYFWQQFTPQNRAHISEKKRINFEDVHQKALKGCQAPAGIKWEFDLVKKMMCQEGFICEAVDALFKLICMPKDRKKLAYDIYYDGCYNLSPDNLRHLFSQLTFVPEELKLNYVGEIKSYGISSQNVANFEQTWIL